VARDEDGGEAKQRWCSSEHAHWRRDGEMMVENDGGASSTLEQRRARGCSKARGGGVVCSGGCSPI
jgi:hypothetical protein